MPGAIYHLDSSNFQQGKWIEELVSASIETPVANVTIILDVRAYLEQLERDGTIVIERWTGRTDDQAVLNHWIHFINRATGNVRDSVIDHARAFIDQMRPHLRTTFEHLI